MPAGQSEREKKQKEETEHIRPCLTEKGNAGTTRTLAPHRALVHGLCVHPGKSILLLEKLPSKRTSLQSAHSPGALAMRHQLLPHAGMVQLGTYQVTGRLLMSPRAPEVPSMVSAARDTHAPLQQPISVIPKLFFLFSQQKFI